ncbi:MAG: hypothetical protein ACK5FT_02345 [Sphingomonadales bacterium]
MNANWLQKYALNLGWFLLILGGISLLDRGMWAYAGMLMLSGGLLNMVNALRLLYLGKKTWLLSPENMYWLNLTGILLLSLGHVFTVKKGISWELLGFLAVSAVFLFAAKSGAGSLQQGASKKASAKR